MMARGGMRRINLIEQEDSQSENSNEIDEDNMVLHVGGGEGNQPFVLKGKINKELFNTEIDSVSPNTIYTPACLRRLLIEGGCDILKTDDKERAIQILQQQTPEFTGIHHS